MMGALDQPELVAYAIQGQCRQFMKRVLRPETCLFGNLDSTLLFRGTPEAVRAEVRRQRRAAAEGAFVIANGSPIVIGTPAANLDAYMEEARKR